MRDSGEHPGPTEDPAPEAPLDETTPPIDQHQEGGEGSGLEPLDQTTAEVREFLGSQDTAENSGRRRN